MNKRAIRRLGRLTKRYENHRTVPALKDVEAALWHAGKLADRKFGGYWPWGSASHRASNIERWTSQDLGWSFPCAEAVALIQRFLQWPSGRIIDVGAGRGLWTKVLRRAFGSDRVVGLDPESTSGDVLQVAFNNWCEETGGPEDSDLLFASWLPSRDQDGSDLGHQILDRIAADDQIFMYVGSGPCGPSGTKDFHDRLGVEFDECASEPLPRVRPSVFPRDFIRAYRKKR